MSARITTVDGAVSAWRYHSGTTVYVESFQNGRLLSCSLQDTGIPFYPQDEDGVPSFDLQVDGESLQFGWELAQAEVEADTCELRIRLRHSLKPVTLELVTRASGGGFFRRRMRLTNTSATAAMGLTSVAPLCGYVWGMTDNLKENLAESQGVPYQAGWCPDEGWGNEGNFRWHDIPLNAELAFGSERGRSGFGVPFVLARNKLYGGYFVAVLAWSANWKFNFQSSCDRNGGKARLRYRLAPDAPAPMRMLAPGESVTLPEVHFGLNHESLDSAIQGWHAHLRAQTLPRVGDGLQPVIYNHWGYTQHELSESSLRREVDIAAETGAELFMVDAGWYADANTAWYDTSGDWMAGNRLPNDLFPIFEYARSKGLICGLWVEIESAGKSSKLTAEHPDWFITRYGNPVARVLDLAKPAVRDYVEGHILRLIERYRLEMFRLDYNLDACEGGFNLRDGRMENTLWRHVEAIYDIFDKVRQRYPAMQLENCSSGGGRCDLGMAARFTTLWTSDWMRMPRTVRILNGLSLAFPPEYLDRLFGVCMNGSTRGNPETQLHVIVLSHPTLSGLTRSLDEVNPDLMVLVKKYVRIYKEFIRPFHRQARVYHHTPEIPGPDGTGWCALELVSADRMKAAAGVFRLVNAKEDSFLLRFRGLDPARRYRVISHPGGLVAEVQGHSLLQDGVTVRLDTALTSRLFLCEAV